jgi:DNA-binding response OmpR family regulator
MRILIVEDEILIALMLTDALEAGGHEVTGMAATEAEALAMCAATLPELALLDINLRDGGSDVVLARAMFDRWRLPMLFASAQVVEARQARDVALGCIGKPYEPETVLRSIAAAREVMRGRTPATLPPGFELFRQAA